MSSIDDLKNKLGVNSEGGVFTNPPENSEDLDHIITDLEHGQYSIHDIPPAEEFVQIIAEAQKAERERITERTAEENRAISSVVNWVCSCLAEQIKRVMQQIRKDGTQAVPPVIARHTIQVKDGNILIEGRRLCGTDRLDEVLGRIKDALGGYHTEVNDLGRRLGDGQVVITVRFAD